jgi:hypothetical protein
MSGLTLTKQNVQAKGEATVEQQHGSIRIMWRINKGIVMTLMAVESEEIKYPTAK